MMRFLLFFVILIGNVSFSYAKTVSSNRDSLNGGFSFTEGNILSTEIKTSFGQIDNFLRNHDNPQATHFLELSPDVFFQTQSDSSLFQLQAKASYFTYDEFSTDDHYDFSVLSKFHLKFADSQKVFFTGLIADEYEYRGTGLSLGSPELLNEGDTKRHKFLNVGYLYGHQNSLARAKVLVGYRDFSYTTRQALTQRFNYSANYLQGDFDYLLTGNTYFSSKIQLEDFSYKIDTDLERKQYLALAGVKWRSTELTQLRLLFGYQKATFDNDIFAEKDRFAWQANILWNPLERVRFNFSSGSVIKDSYKIVKSISYATYYGIDIGYDFNDSLLLKLNTKIVNEDIVEIDNEIKEDSFETTAVIQYQWRYWLSVFVQISYDSFDSSIVNYNYDLTAASMGVKVTF